MARARLKSNPTGSNFDVVGRVLMAAWLKSLPDAAGRPGSPLDASEIATALTGILQLPESQKVVVVIDDDTKLHVVVPQIPTGIDTKEKLITYLHNKFDDSTKSTDVDNPFNPKNKDKHGTGGNFPKKRTFAADFGDASLFGCGR